MMRLGKVWLSVGVCSKRGRAGIGAVGRGSCALSGCLFDIPLPLASHLAPTKAQEVEVSLIKTHCHKEVFTET